MPCDLATIPATLAMVLAEAPSSEPVAVPFWLELVAIVVASVSGALTAREKKLDLVGAVCLAVLCSLGGGLLRDMVLQVGNVYILNQPLALPASIITAVVVFLIPSLVQNQDRLIAILDIFAVGLYAATGADKTLVYGFAPTVCVMMGFFTGVGGGMLRDVCLGQVPYIFQPSNLYAVAAIAGATVYVALASSGISHVFAVVLCVVVTMGLRWWSLRYNIVSPADLDLASAVPEVLDKLPLKPVSDRRLNRQMSGLARLRRSNLAAIARREQEREDVRRMQEPSLEGGGRRAAEGVDAFGAVARSEGEQSPVSLWGDSTADINVTVEQDGSDLLRR